MDCYSDTSISDLARNIYVGSNKGNVKTVIGNSSNSRSLGERTNVAGYSPKDKQENLRKKS